MPLRSLQRQLVQQLPPRRSRQNIRLGHICDVRPTMLGITPWEPRLIRLQRDWVSNILQEQDRKLAFSTRVRGSRKNSKTAPRRLPSKTIYSTNIKGHLQREAQ